MLRARFGLRSKLLLFAALLLILPWLGYRYILTMEQYLVRGQQQVVLGTARAIATSLSERPELFTAQANLDGDGAGLYLYPLNMSLDVHDSTLNDWRSYQQYEQFIREGSVLPNSLNQLSSFRQRRLGLGGEGDPLNYYYLLAQFESQLYLYLRVEDRFHVLRKPAEMRLDRSDALQLAFINDQGSYERLLIAPTHTGQLEAWQATADFEDLSAKYRDPRLEGQLIPTRNGYDYELTIPLETLGEKLAIAVYDVDSEEQRSLDAVVSTSDLSSADTLGNLLQPTFELDRIVTSLGNTSFFIRVMDRTQRVLISTGNLSSAEGLNLTSPVPENGLWLWIRSNLLYPVYDLVLTEPTYRYLDNSFTENRLGGGYVISALTGNPQAGLLDTSLQITSNDESAQARVIEAAWPIKVGQEIIGAVVVDQNMAGIDSFRNEALRILIDSMLGIILLITMAMLLFANKLSQRIRQLRNQAERILDDKGRFTNTIVPSRVNDEVGDLSRSFANIVDRLGQYTHYLENMSSRLSHELRTPVTVVRSSLENLAMLTDNNEAHVFIERAEEGIKRLNLILSNMSEAARLEQLLQHAEREPAQLNLIIQACVEEYRQIYPKSNFTTEISQEPVCVAASAEHIAQLMDKVVANAVDFAYPETSIHLTCNLDLEEAVVTVSNHGPWLDPAMQTRIFDSLVSVRSEKQRETPHLGMGLHIARMIAEYHRGYIYADNLLEEEGVIVVLRLPTEKINSQ